jgi:hypothetical protein
VSDKIPKAGDYVRHIESGEKKMVLWISDFGTVVVEEEYPIFLDIKCWRKWDYVLLE